MTTDEAAKANGFTSAQEMFTMIGEVWINTPDRLAAFKHWQTEDGSKAGLARLIAETTAPSAGSAR